MEKSIMEKTIENITTVEKKPKKYSNNHSKDNSKNNNNCLAELIFFGIIHLDDGKFLKAQAVQLRTANRVFFWVCILEL